MNSIEKNLNELDRLQTLQQRPHWMNRLHPLGKLLISVIYIFTVVSFDKYALVSLIVMSVYPIFGFIVGELSFKEGIYRMRLILPLVIFAGIFNPVFDRHILFWVGMSGSGISVMPAAGGAGFVIPVTYGMISMFTLMIKGFFAVLASYILIATTSIEDICYALQVVHVPKTVITVIMLIYRYFGVMAQEANRMATAYKLRAPHQKGIHYRAWGTFVGQWLLRSMDKAGVVYESMLLRGFKGDFTVRKKAVTATDIVYSMVWCLVFVIIRHGGLFG